MALAAEELERLHLLDHRGLLRLIAFAGLWLGAGAVGVLLTSSGGVLLLGLLVTLPLGAAALHGISLFTHEGVHGVLFRDRRANDLLASVCAWPVLQNFHGYRVLHLRHHAHLGQPGDPDHYPNYTRWTWGVFLMHWGRLLLGYPAYIMLIPILGFRQGTPRDRVGIALELVGVACFVAVLFQLPFSWVLVGWIGPMVLINTMVNIRGMSQHTLLPDTDDPLLGSRTIVTIPLVRFFMCNENYHLEHHLHPGVPWYHLPVIHEGMKGASVPVIPSYGSFVADFVRESLRRGPFAQLP